MIARPNICGFNAFHTSGGVLLRPSSTRPDAKLPPNDVWTWKHLAAIGTELTGYPSHSLYEDFTWDPDETMSGASDDWAYEHLGVFAWTTEFWDIVLAATGHKQSTHFWYMGPTDDERLAVARWLDALDDESERGFVDWYPFEHPQLGAVELGGFDHLRSWTNPPLSMLCDEVDRHADFAVAQALAAPCLSLTVVAVEPVGHATWRVTVGMANTGWLPTTVTTYAAKHDLVRPIVADIEGDGVAVLDGPARRTLGQLSGASSVRLGVDGTPDRTVCRWLVSGDPGTEVTVTARHQRAGTVATSIVLASS